MDLQVRSGRVEARLGWRVVDHVVEMFLAEPAILEHRIRSARSTVACNGVALAAQFLQQFEQLKLVVRNSRRKAPERLELVITNATLLGFQNFRCFGHGLTMLAALFADVKTH